MHWISDHLCMLSLHKATNSLRVHKYHMSSVTTSTPLQKESAGLGVQGGRDDDDDEQEDKVS